MELLSGQQRFIFMFVHGLAHTWLNNSDTLIPYSLFQTVGVYQRARTRLMGKDLHAPVRADPRVRPLSDQARMAYLIYSVTTRTTPSTFCRFKRPRRSR